MITRTLKSLFWRNPASAATHTRLRQFEGPPLRLELLENRYDICGVMPTAFDDEYWATAGDLLTVDAPGVLTNDSLGGQGGEEDTDPCGTTLRAVLVQGPDEGSLSFNSDGSFTFQKYTAGGVTFTYMACDDLGYCSTIATVNIYVQKAAGQVAFFQDTNPPNGPFGTYWGYGPYGQPGSRSTGAYYGSAAQGVWQAAPAWATSWVEIWGPGQVCNSGPMSDTGTLHVKLQGTPGSRYWVDMQIDVSVSTTATANNPYAQASIKDLTGTYNPAVLGNPRTTLTQNSDSFSMFVTVTTVIPPAVAPAVLGEVEILEVRPTMCGSGPAGTADFTGTVYVSAIR